MPSEAPLWTLERVIDLFASNPPSERARLIEEVPWKGVDMTIPELVYLPSDWPFIYREFLKANPDYLKDNINTLDELNQFILTDQYIEQLSPEDKQELVKHKSHLINKASVDELEAYFTVPGGIRGYLIEGLNLEDFLKFSKKYVSGIQERVFELLPHVADKPEYVYKLILAVLPVFFDEDRKSIVARVVGDLNLDDLLRFSKQYVAGNKDRALDILREINKEYLPELLLSILPLLSDEDQIYIFNLYDLPLAKNIGFVTGLKGAIYEGSQLQLANQITQLRFQTLSGSTEPLPFHVIDNYEDPADFYNPVQVHGDLQGIHTQWDGKEPHAFSFHLIKDGENTQFWFMLIVDFDIWALPRMSPQLMRILLLI